MDDLAHDFPLNHRKRKQDSDDKNDNNTPDSSLSSDRLASDSSVISSPGPSNAPRQQWLASEAGNALWSSPASPQVTSPLSSPDVLNAFMDNPAKRPRLDKDGPTRANTRRLPPRKPYHHKIVPTKLSTVRSGSDVEDIGIVPKRHPGPLSGTLLRTPKLTLTKPDELHSQPPTPVVPFDVNSVVTPSLQPLINRQTLRELDLDAILRNPQLRHDLLFDPGLQFRPTCSRRKREISEKYWLAIRQEVETGCTCVTFDTFGKPQPVICACMHVPLPDTPESSPSCYWPTPNLVTVRTTSRIQNLLTEFLEVLLLVIQPLSSISGIYVNPSMFETQMQEHSAQAAYIRSIFDPALIEQELKRDMFDPSGLFEAIGTTLKGHCAPMRDRAVEYMVNTAKTCAPGGSGTKADAVKAVRMCMEILELMKLDIANHQLQTLRPFLIRTSGQFELKSLKLRTGPESSFEVTREWLQFSHSELLDRAQPISHAHYPRSIQYSSLSQNHQICIATSKGIVDLIFNPPSVTPPTSPVNTPPTSPISGPTSSPFTSFPETLYLDNSRLLQLSSDATDIAALYMFILLYRQLVFSDSNDPTLDPPKVDDAELLRLKREIRDIGASRLGYCFSKDNVAGDSSFRSRSDEREAERRRNIKQDIVLQVAKRAKDARCRSQQAVLPATPFGEAPDERMLNLAQRWADTNLQAGSALSTMLHNRIREAVFNAVVSIGYPCRQGSNGADAILSTQPDPTSILPSTLTAGMEPLTDEIRTLADKIARLALIHLNAYLPLYEKEGFF